MVIEELNIEFYKSHSLDKSADSVFIISVFFKISLTVTFLEFYFIEVRTKQQTFAADL